MNAQARVRIREIVANYGTVVFQTPRVLEFQTAQVLHDMPAERDALVAALKHDFVRRMQAGENDLEKLAGEFHQKTNVPFDAAGWALESWRELIHGVRSASLDRGDAYLSYNKTKGMSYRPPTRDQFARSGLIAGIIAGVLVGAFWGGVKAVSLARPVSRTVAHYDPDDFEAAYGYSSPTYRRQSVDLELGKRSIAAWFGWIIAGGIIGCVAGGTSALYLSQGSMKFVGGYSGAIVGAIAGLMTGHRLIRVGANASFSDQFAQILMSLLLGVIIGVVLGGFRDLLLNLRAFGGGPLLRTLLFMQTR